MIPRAIYRSTDGPSPAAWITMTPVGFLVLFLLAGRTDVARFIPGVRDALPWEIRGWAILLLACSVPLAAWGVRGQRISTWAGFSAFGFGLFMVYMGITSLWAPDVLAAVAKAYDLFLMLLSVGALILVLRSAPADRVVGAFWAFMLGTAGALAAIGVLEILRGGGGGRLAVLGGGPNIFGRNMGLFMLASLHCWHHRFGPRLLWLCLAGIGMLLVVLSGSRGALVATVGGAVTFIALARIPIRKVLVGILYGAAGLVPLILLTPLGRAVSDAFQSRIVGLLLEQVYTAGRDRIYSAALAQSSSSPIIGLGLSGFRFETFTYPHNVFLEAMVEGGIVGLLLLLVPLLVWAVGQWRWRCKGGDAATSAGFVLVFLAAQFTGDFFDGRAVPLLLVLSASLWGRMREVDVRDARGEVGVGGGAR